MTPNMSERPAALTVFASSKETAKNRFFAVKTLRALVRLRPGERNLARRPYNHRSTSTSPEGLEQQMSTLPVAGGSSGSGSYWTVPPINAHSQVWQTPVRQAHFTGTSQASANSSKLENREFHGTVRPLRVNEICGPVPGSPAGA